MLSLVTKDIYPRKYILLLRVFERPYSFILQAFCYKGQCVPSADTQCRDLWGPGIKITDQFRFLKKICPPTPPLSQHFALNDKSVLMLVCGGGG